MKYLGFALSLFVVGCGPAAALRYGAASRTAIAVTMAEPRHSHAAVALPDGGAMVVGGFTTDRCPPPRWRAHGPRQQSLDPRVARVPRAHFHGDVDPAPRS